MKCYGMKSVTRNINLVAVAVLPPGGGDRKVTNEEFAENEITATGTENVDIF
jgi:hypothetical protein